MERAAGAPQGLFPDITSRVFSAPKRKRDKQMGLLKFEVKIRRLVGGIPMETDLHLI